MKKIIGIVLSITLVLTCLFSAFSAIAAPVDTIQLPWVTNATAGENTLLKPMASYDFNDGTTQGITTSNNSPSSYNATLDLTGISNNTLLLDGNAGGNLTTTTSKLSPADITNSYFKADVALLSNVWNVTELRFGVSDSGYYALRFNCNNSTHTLVLLKKVGNTETVLKTLNLATDGIVYKDREVMTVEIYRYYTNTNHIYIKVTPSKTVWTTNTIYLTDNSLTGAGNFTLMTKNQDTTYDNIEIYEWTKQLIDETASKYIKPITYDFEDGTTQGIVAETVSSGSVAFAESYQSMSKVLSVNDSNFTNGVTTTPLGESSYTDFSMEFDMAVNNGSVRTLVCFGGTSFNNCYALIIAGQDTLATGHYLRQTGKQIKLVKITNGAISQTFDEFTFLGSASTLSVSQKYHVVLTVKGNTVQASFATAGTQAIFARPLVAELDEAYAGGEVFFYQLARITYFDNIKLYDLSNESIFSQLEECDELLDENSINFYALHDGVLPYTGDVTLTPDTNGTVNVSLANNALTFTATGQGGKTQTPTFDKASRNMYFSFDYSHGRAQWGECTISFKDNDATANNNGAYKLKFSAATSGTLKLELYDYYNKVLGYKEITGLTATSVYTVETKIVGSKITVVFYAKGATPTEDNTFTVTDNQNQYTGTNMSIYTNDASCVIDNLIIVNLVEECDHTNTKDKNVVSSTYFTAGSKDIVCNDCAEIVEKGVKLERATDNAITFTPSYSGSTLTIEWEYSDALLTDIHSVDTAELNLTCAIDGKEIINLPEFETANVGGKIEIDGFNIARLNQTVSLNIAFDFGGAYDAALVTELNDIAKYTVVAKEVANYSDDRKNLSALVDAIGDRDTVEIQGNNTDCDDFSVEYSKVDIAKASAQFKFIAEESFVTAVKTNSQYNDGRTVKLVVNIGGKDYSVKLNELRTNITVTISGLSFSQMYDDITAKLVITYAAEGVADIESGEIILSFDDAIAASEDSAAEAFEALIKKKSQ